MKKKLLMTVVPVLFLPDKVDAHYCLRPQHQYRQLALNTTDKRHDSNFSLHMLSKHFLLVYSTAEC